MPPSWSSGSTAWSTIRRSMGCVDLSRPIPPGALLRRDGRPVTESVVDRALTTQAILDQEDALIDWADRRLAVRRRRPPGGQRARRRRAERRPASRRRAVAGADDLVLVVGPAGTGKTTALAPASPSSAPTAGLCSASLPSATAADVLSDETGVAADTLDKLLARAPPHPATEPRYDLPVGATLIVDEAGMLPTAKLAELADLADVKGWRVVLVGDPQQFSAVGRGGMFGLLVDTFGAIELERVHRFEHRLGTRSQPPLAARRRQRRRRLRRQRTPPRWHHPADGARRPSPAGASCASQARTLCSWHRPTRLSSA